MVFTTLSSTGRRVFNRLESGHFETVLIDEAAQASEVTTLQALTFGCRRSILKLILFRLPINISPTYLHMKPETKRVLQGLAFIGGA